MTKSRILGAAAILAAIITTPAMAQVAIQEPGAYAQAHPWATDYYYYRYGPSYYRYGPPGFWPGDVVVGGAIGAADAIATAPFRDRDSYAYYGGGTDDDYYAQYYGDRPVSRRTTCGLQPGATYLGPDGRWYPC